ncbi:MAG: hypothetical protein GWO04_46615, partial [Actinobacteria bacterium]|nr:hypothetical protein [Actinomycetota bacterium]
MNAGSRLITLNGVNVTSSFGYSGTATSASSGGTVTLSPGTNTLSAKICDQSGRCTTQTTGYTYDGVAPAIDITPGSQTTGASSLSVLITWDDDRALNDASRVIRLNGDTVTSAFTYDFGEGDVDMQSEARITLVPGPNTLIAEICDVAGNCNAAVATYSREATAPTVAVTPASGAYRFASREATFELCDDTSLSEASFTVTLNGTQDVTVDFEYVGGGKAGCGAYATANGVVSLSAGSNTLEGRICDGYNNCRTGRADYTYDGSLPAVSVNPAGGDYEDASRPVT